MLTPQGAKVITLFPAQELPIGEQILKSLNRQGRQERQERQDKKGKKA
ncbi:MAG: hypothetical protein KIT18_01125 [Burkholderiales bacterium]|nr:hypothetical protein [Burkholderiales bacterium]